VKIRNKDIPKKDLVIFWNKRTRIPGFHWFGSGSNSDSAFGGRADKKTNPRRDFLPPLAEPVDQSPPERFDHL